MKKISVLGSTGSVGSQTIELIRDHYASEFQIQTLSCNRNIELLLLQADTLKPKNLVVANPDAYKLLKNRLTNINVVLSRSLPEDLLYENDLIVVATVGLDELNTTYLAAKNDIKIATSNKEIIVCGGNILKKHRKNIIPLDSEHHAIFELLKKENSVSEIILTATGGPFFRRNKQNISVDNALNHPVWKMGKKNSIDSATMMNKVLEVVEAHYLFDIDKKNIKILIHPEAIVHGIITKYDGTQHALLSKPDMKIGINSALLSLIGINKFNSYLSLAGKSLSFFVPDNEEFPVIDFLDTDQEISINAANDVAVKEFLSGKIKYDDIPRLIRRTLDLYSYSPLKINGVDDIIQIYNAAKDTCENINKTTIQREGEQH